MSQPRMPILTDEGQIWLEIDDPAERSLVGSYWNAIDSYKAGDVERSRRSRACGSVVTCS
jgi:hypothetical protein